MPILDFKEISQANLGSGKQDDFEHLAAEVLGIAGFSLLRGPSRGADAGKDLIVEERRSGKYKDTLIKSLVSCKHKAHSGKSVSVDDELNLTERLEAADCEAFIGFYSTVASSALDARLASLSFASQIFSGNSIEKELLGSSAGLEIAERYFPVSIKEWIRENPKPAQLFEKQLLLPCAVCGEDLLKADSPKDREGIVGFCESGTSNDEAIVSVRAYHKGKCNFLMERRYKAEGLWEQGWEELNSFLEPPTYLRNLITSRELISKMNDAAWTEYENILVATFPFISRELTQEERNHQRDLRKFGMSL